MIIIIIFNLSIDFMRSVGPFSFPFASPQHRHILVSRTREVPHTIPGDVRHVSWCVRTRWRLLYARLHPSCAHLCAAVFASSTPPPCIQLRTEFMPPSGSSFRLLPLRWMLSWIPNIKERRCGCRRVALFLGASLPSPTVHLFSLRSFAEEPSRLRAWLENRSLNCARVLVDTVVGALLKKKKDNLVEAKSHQDPTTNGEADRTCPEGSAEEKRAERAAKRENLSVVLEIRGGSCQTEV